MLYFSSLLKTIPEYAASAGNLFTALSKCGEEYTFFDGAKDIWAKDYMPVKTGSSKYISFRYEPCYLKDDEETGKCLFDHLSYRFASGDTVVIRGNSGSGKTSLLKLLLRFEKPTAGEIKINGNDIESYDERSFREQVSVASQSTEFLACSIRDNLLLSGANHTDDEIIETLSLLELDKLIEKLPEGLDTIVSSETVAFSDGEKKRMGIARALLSNASVLIFDEPTASLDNKTKGPIMESIRNQCKNRILIVVTHDEKIVQPTDIQINIGE